MHAASVLSSEVFSSAGQNARGEEKGTQTSKSGRRSGDYSYNTAPCSVEEVEFNNSFLTSPPRVRAE
jgi:hypothetical protein